MWYVNSIKAEKSVEVFLQMGKSKAKKETCHLPDNSVTPWHIDLAYIDKIYYLVIYDYDTNNLVL